MYNPRMKDGDLVTEHLKPFNTVVSQLLYVDINILMNTNVSVYYVIYQTRRIVWIWPYVVIQLL
jgi:hypothetical protein